MTIDLQAIQRRCDLAKASTARGSKGTSYADLAGMVRVLANDLPALLDEVERLRAGPTDADIDRATEAFMTAFRWDRSLPGAWIEARKKVQAIVSALSPDGGGGE